MDEWNMSVSEAMELTHKSREFIINAIQQGCDAWLCCRRREWTKNGPHTQEGIYILYDRMEYESNR